MASKEVKDQLHYLEKELMDLSVDPEGGGGRGSGKKPKITKDNFLNAQKQQGANSDATATSENFLYNLITRPVSRKTSREVTTAVVPMSDTVKPVPHRERKKSLDSSSSSSARSEAFVVASKPSSQIDSVFQMRLYDEKRKLEQEYQRCLAEMNKSLETLRHKRVCDRESYKDQLSKYDRDLNELKAINKSLEEANTRAVHNLELSENKNREYKSEMEKLHRDLERMEQRGLKANQNVMELEGKMKGERQAYNTRIMQLEAQISDLKEQEQKLKSRAEMMQVKYESATVETQEAQQQIAAQKTVEERLVDELARLQKKMESEISDYENLKSTLEFRIHEQNIELQTERDRLLQTQQELRNAEQREAKVQARLHEKEKDSRELASLKDLHATVSSERLMLQTQLRALTDECDRMKSQLIIATQKEQAATIRAEDAEQENHKLKKKIEALQVQCSKSIVFNAAQKLTSPQIETLTDADGAPISRLKAANVNTVQPMARPVWWFEGDSNEKSVSVVRRPSPMTHSLSVPANHSIISNQTVIPVCHSMQGEGSNEGLQILKTQRRNVMRELAKMPPNPAYRTTEENETWDKLKKQIAQIEHDIRLLDHQPADAD